jgi:hypothetical protein
MGAHMREELVRFQDEGQRRVAGAIEQLRSREQDMLREEDRRLTMARDELMRQHQGALESQVRSMVGGLSNSTTVRAGFDRPATPLSADAPLSFGASEQVQAAPLADPFAQPQPGQFGYTQ